MRKLIGTTLLIAGLASAAFAGGATVPEIDATTAISAITLITGAALVIRSRKK